MRDAGHTVQERILCSAEKLFAAKGYEAATTREIVRDAGTSLSAIQAHFKSKENLYAEVLKRTCESCYVLNRSIFSQIEESQAQGFLNKESIWNHIVELISTTTEWAFLPENTYKVMLMNNELLHPTELYPLIRKSILDFFHYFEILFISYTGAKEQFWAKEVSFIIVTTIFDARNYPKTLQGVMCADIHEEHTNARIKLQLKEYLFHSLRPYLNLKAEKQI